MIEVLIIIEIYIIHMYLLVEGWDLKSVASQDDEWTGKDESEVKSTPPIYINQETRGRTAVHGF